MRELSSLFMTHRLIVMYAPVKFHEYIHKVWSYGPDTKVGRTDYGIKSRGNNSKTKKMRELSSFFMTHRLIVMYAPVKFP